MRKTAESLLGSVHYRDFLQTEAYFVNFLREPPEPTGMEPDDFVLEAPKTYEEIPRYFKHISVHMNDSRF